MTTEAEAVADLATQAANAALRKMEPGEVYNVVTSHDAGRVTIDTEYLAGTPTRPRGTVEVQDANTFLAVVKARHFEEEAVGVYADEEHMSLVAILNDDAGGSAGWRDHRVNLSLRRTEEWQLWTSSQGPGEQSKFAEVIEAGLAEIVEPSAATMLELAQTFSASVGAQFVQGGQLATGERQFTYSESVSAKAGSGGTLSIPPEFKIGVKPFYGSPAYEVVARLRYRVREGKLTIGYDLVKPHEVERAAFRDVVEAVTAGLSDPLGPVYAGRAPGPTIAR